MKWLAPAKINLSLRVLGRRADGFHEIESLMAPLTLADELEFTVGAGREAGSIELTCSDPTLPTGEANLAYRAAALFRDRHDREFPGVRIALTKRVPHGAGLGGGSSDAATVLLALNTLFDGGYSREELAAMSAELGSDIPFFVYQSAAWCRGRGERVTPVEFGAELSLLLIKPEFSIPTPWAYQRWRDSREIPGVSYTAQAFPWGEMINDLERPVYEKYLALADMKTWLLSEGEAVGALLSGSGSTMIAVLRGSESAGSLFEKVRRRYGNVWAHPCSTVTSTSSSTDIFASTLETMA